MKIVIPKIEFPIYGIIIVISIVIGMIYIYMSLKKENYNTKNIILYFLMYISFSFYFGKLYTVIANPKENILTTGLSSYGGLIGVILSAIIYEKISPSNNKIIKYAILSLPLVYGLSKIACFIVGCCGGIPYNGFGSVIYKNYLNIPQFPIQILETIVFIIIFVICNHRKNDKNIITKTIIITATAKFLLDFLRYEHLNKIISTNQIFSIILIFSSIMYIITKSKKLNK